MVLCSVSLLSAQEMSLEELKAKKAELEAAQAVKQGEANAFQGDIDKLSKQILVLSGWRTGFSGIAGLSLGRSNRWISSPNPTSSSTGLSLGLTAFAKRNATKYFWNNKLIANKAWQDIDIVEGEDDKLFDQGTVDILNVSSLFGYKLSEKIAISALAELNSSIESFLQPGTFDIGAGATWTPMPNLVVVVHPLNYHVAWSADGNVDAQGAVGAKLRADYQDDFSIKGRKISWSSTLTSFLPYTNKKTTIGTIDKYGVPLVDGMGAAITREAGLFEYTWLNSFSFQVFKGLGVGANLGLRDADFEFDGLQTFYTLGLTYTL
jgi:hypothetical protein